MPETRDTDTLAANTVAAVEIPIPVAGSANPYTRLEAMSIPARRLRVLAGLLEARMDGVFIPALAAVVQSLSDQFRTAQYGAVPEVEDLVDGAVSTREWAREVSRMLYPPAAR